MSNIICSAKQGRVLHLAVPMYSLLSRLYDDDRMSLLQEKDFEKMYDYVEGESEEYNAKTN